MEVREVLKVDGKEKAVDKEQQGSFALAGQALERVLGRALECPKACGWYKGGYIDTMGY